MKILPLMKKDNWDFQNKYAFSNYYLPGQHLCTWGFLLLPVLDSGIHGSNDSDSTDSSGKNHASFFLDDLKTLKKNLRRKSRGKYKIAWSI